MTDRVHRARAVPRAFLFADLRGYSRFTEERGDHAARELLAAYRRLVRRVIEEQHGAEIRTEGDSFYVVFDSVSDAIRAALSIQQAAVERLERDEPIRVGIGIHAGEVEDDREGIVSSAVNIAARVCAVAEAGEVLVTETVRSLTRTYLDVAFAPRGRRRLKGITDPVALYRVTAADATIGRMAAAGRPVVRVAGGIGLVVVLGVAAVVGMTLAHQPEGAARSASASPSATQALGAAVSKAPQATSTPMPSFPSDAEQDLLTRLPASIAEDCERAHQEVPAYVDSVIAGIPPKTYSTIEPLPIVAGLSCLTDQTRVVYWEAADAASIDALFAQRVGRRGIAAGSCANPPALETWTAGAHVGQVLCSIGAGVSVIEWTYGPVPIYAVATRRDEDLATLLAWWRDAGRLLGR